MKRLMVERKRHKKDGEFWAVIDRKNPHRKTVGARNSRKQAETLRDKLNTQETSYPGGYNGRVK